MIDRILDAFLGALVMWMILYFTPQPEVQAALEVWPGMLSMIPVQTFIIVFIMRPKC